MSRLTFARSAGAAGPKMTDVRYIDRQTDRQTDRGRVELPRWSSLTLAPIIKYGNYHGRLIGKALNGLHSNVLLGQITISKTRSKRVNENITRICTLNQ